MQTGSSCPVRLGEIQQEEDTRIVPSSLFISKLLSCTAMPSNASAAWMCPPMRGTGFPEDHNRRPPRVQPLTGKHSFARSLCQTAFRQAPLSNYTFLRKDAEGTYVRPDDTVHACTRSVQSTRTAPLLKRRYAWKLCFPTQYSATKAVRQAGRCLSVHGRIRKTQACFDDC